MGRPCHWSKRTASLRYRRDIMTATPRTRTPLALLALASLLVLLGPARAAGQAHAAWPPEQLAPGAPLAAGEVTPRERTSGLRPAADRRDQRGGHRPATAALASVAPGAALLLAGLVRPTAGGRRRRGRRGPAGPRSPPPLQPA
jgi:hypothetical protein